MEEKQAITPSQCPFHFPHGALPPNHALPLNPFANQNGSSLFTLKVEKVVNISRSLGGGLGERAKEVPVAFEQTGHEAQEGSLDFPFQASPAATHCLIVCQQEFQGGLFLWSSVSWETICLRVKGTTAGLVLPCFSHKCLIFTISF